MSYSVNEIFYTLQGEGANAGKPAVFCRFSGCNLWSGLEKNRDTAICRFCDTEFVGTDGPGGGKFSGAEELAAAVQNIWPASAGEERLVVCTGGEPLLQIDSALIGALHFIGFEIAIETNGTLPAPGGIDWICVSPKAGTDLIIRSGEELKLVYPQACAMPKQYESLAFNYYFLQPMYGPNFAQNTEATIAFCLENPNWRLSIQAHKVIGIP